MGRRRSSVFVMERHLQELDMVANLELVPGIGGLVLLLPAKPSDRSWGTDGGGAGGEQLHCRRHVIGDRDRPALHHLMGLTTRGWRRRREAVEGKTKSGAWGSYHQNRLLAAGFNHNQMVEIIKSRWNGRFGLGDNNLHTRLEQNSARRYNKFDFDIKNLVRVPYMPTSNSFTQE
ncbi:hypothetical protein BHM03_00017512 [Ensete ventricosum]|nr:hypothetical protein BHM03_00017512 [Ensete ventricosum]